MITDHKTPFVIPVFIPHAGCPHRCIFCNQTSTTRHLEGIPNAKQLHKTIDEFLSYRKDARRFTEISFYGGNFLGLPIQTILLLLQKVMSYISQGQVQGIRFSTRPDTIDPERLDLLAQFPVTTIELGVQSLDNQVLAASRRGHTAEDTEIAIKMLKAHPYRLGLQMMVGLPDQTSQSALATGRRLAEMRPDFVRIYPTLVLKGSPLERWYQQGRYSPMEMQSAVKLVSELYALFTRQGIKVVRMGLQATEGLDAGKELVAGPYHPAFGELVHSALWLDLLLTKLPTTAITGDAVEIEVHPKLISRVKGHGKTNLQILARERTIPPIKIRLDSSLSSNQIRIDGKVCKLLN